MTRYRVQVTGEMQVETDSSEEFIVTQVRDMLGDDLSLAAQGLTLEVVATEVKEEEGV